MAHTPIIAIAGHAGSGKDTVGKFIQDHYNATTMALADPMKRFAKKIFGFTEEQLWGPSEMRNAEVGLSVYTIDERFNVSTIEAFLNEVLPDATTDHRRFAFEALDDWFSTYCYTPIMDKGAISPRIVLQTMGTEWGRKVSTDMWAKYAIKNAVTLLGGQKSYTRVGGIKDDPTTSYEFVAITDTRFRNELLAVNSVNGVAVKVVRPSQEVKTVGISGHQSERELDGIPSHLYDEVIVNDSTFENLFGQVETAMAVQFGR